MYPLVFVGAVAAFAVSAVSGGGAGLVLLPLIGLVLPAAQVPAALSIGTAASSASRLALFRRSVRWDIVRWFVPAALPSAACGAWLLSRFDPLWIELLLGLFLVGNIFAAFRPSKPQPATTLPRAMLVAIGAAAGFLSGFTGAVGVAFNAFYLRAGLRKEEVVATRAANEILIHVVKLGFYAAFGLMSLEALRAGALVAGAAVLSAFGARRLLAGLSESLFRRLGHAAMALAGIAMLGSAGTALAARHEIGVRAHLGTGGVEARLNWHRAAMSLEWAPGESPELERTVALDRLPPRIRGVAERAGKGAIRVVCEEVRTLSGRSWEISVTRADGRTKLKV